MKKYLQTFSYSTQKLCIVILLTFFSTLAIGYSDLNSLETKLQNMTSQDAGDFGYILTNMFDITTGKIKLKFLPDHEHIWKNITLGIYYLENVGIGTDTPSEKLEVVGNVKVSGDLSVVDSMNGLDYLFKVDTEADVIQTSQHIKEFSGILNYYVSSDGTIYTIKQEAILGTIKKSESPSFIHVRLYGSYNGLSDENIDYKEWLIYVGENISTVLLKESGIEETNQFSKLYLYPIEKNEHPIHPIQFNKDGVSYKNIKIENQGFQIKIVAYGSPIIKSYVYTVKYYSGTKFTPFKEE